VRIPAELEHADAREFGVGADLFACPIHFIVQRFANSIRAGSASSLAKPTMLESLEDGSIVCQNRNADPNAVKTCLD